MLFPKGDWLWIEPHAFWTAAPAVPRTYSKQTSWGCHISKLVHQYGCQFHTAEFLETWGESLRRAGDNSLPSKVVINSRGTHLCTLEIMCNSRNSPGPTWRLSTIPIAVINTSFACQPPPPNMSKYRVF